MSSFKSFLILLSVFWPWSEAGTAGTVSQDVKVFCPLSKPKDSCLLTSISLLLAGTLAPPLWRLSPWDHLTRAHSVLSHAPKWWWWWGFVLNMGDTVWEKLSSLTLSRATSSTSRGLNCFRPLVTWGQFSSNPNISLPDSSKTSTFYPVPPNFDFALFGRTDRIWTFSQLTYNFPG